MPYARCKYAPTMYVLRSIICYWLRFITEVSMFLLNLRLQFPIGLCERVFDLIPSVLRQEYYELHPEGNDSAAAKHSNKKLKVMATRYVLAPACKCVRVARKTYFNFITFK
jgi:hypothetical protein